MNADGLFMQVFCGQSSEMRDKRYTFDATGPRAHHLHRQFPESREDERCCTIQLSLTTPRSDCVARRTNFNNESIITAATAPVIHRIVRMDASWPIRDSNATPWRWVAWNAG